jgi:hypothetical protein
LRYCTEYGSEKEAVIVRLHGDTPLLRLSNKCSVNLTKRHEIVNVTISQLYSLSSHGGVKGLVTLAAPWRFERGLLARGGCSTLTVRKDATLE